MDAFGLERKEVENIITKGMKWKEEKEEKWHALMNNFEIVFQKSNDTIFIITVYPEERKNETLGLIKQGLEDFSISRSKTRAKNWGVPVPNDPEQIIYVWY